MIRKILTYPKDKDTLSQISQEVQKEEDISNLITDLKDTLAAQYGGKGISAIQIGVPKRVCICAWGDKEIVMINPVITRARGSQEYMEGCLSVPGIFKPIKRYQKVWCEYLNEKGEKEMIADGGRMSDIIQHELDHFEGECKIV